MLNIQKILKLKTHKLTTNMNFISLGQDKALQMK